MKRLTAFLCMLVVFFCMPQLVRAEEIVSYFADITINTDGTINTEETIAYDFGQDQRHGIFRDIPFVKTNDEGKKFVLAFNQISVNNEAGKTYQFTQTEEGDNLRLKIGDSDRTITGAHTYVISYRVSGALAYFSDHDELYWNITGNNWGVPIEDVQTTILLPEQFQESQVKRACFTGGFGSGASNCRTSYKDRMVAISASSLLPQEGLTVVVGFPKGAVTVLEPKPYVTFFETMWGKIALVGIPLVAFFWYIATPGIVVYRWSRYGRDPKPAMGVVSAWFDTPKTKDHRRLRPAEVGALIDETVHPRDITSTIIDLARRRYLKIIETKKEQFELERLSLPNDGDALLPFEQTFLDALFKSGSSLQLKDAKLAGIIPQIQNAIYDQVVSDGFFQKSPQAIRTLYGVLGAFAVVTGNILLAIIAFTFGMAMPRKTLRGAQAAAVAQSLKNFLSSQKEKLAFQAENQMFFEKFLPYAVAFGVEKIWAERFRDIHLSQPEWYEGTYTNSIVLTRSLGSGLQSSFISATTTRSSSGFSSGFSGGSSGGGGGGSW